MKDKERILVIVESPNKVKTIKQFLPDNYIVMASVGHITEINNSGKFNMGIDANNKFKPDYIVSSDKKDIVKKLKDQVELCDKVILASDPDREGELISFMLKKFLKIPDNKYERITYHEITKKAILEALNNPRKIDTDMSMSAMTRARLDKIVGFRLSPVSRELVGARSVGRCQSAGLKVLVEREEQIKAFKEEKYYELLLHFSKGSYDKYEARYVCEDKTHTNTSSTTKRFDSFESVSKVANECKGNEYKVTSIEEKERSVNPKLPFTTSTFQQEVSSKLGISVKKSMEIAQKLFEGLDINGQHIALITYIRTDSTEFAPEFVEDLKTHIINNFGKEYYSAMKKAKKSETAQDGHEAIRVVDLNMTPDKLSNFIKDESLLKVYTIIYKRTLASSMSPCIMKDVDYVLYNKDHKFVMTTHNVSFLGFKKVYDYKEDDDEIVLFDALKVNDVAENPTLESVEKTTRPPKRFSEASLIKELDKLGIGRPSTYATIVGVLLDKTRGYCNVEDKVLVPTEKGIELSKFLDKAFPDIINVNYTVEMEKSLDLISEGKLNDVEFLSKFYTKLEEDINKVSKTSKSIDEKCPECGSDLVYRKGKYGPFIGCSSYPKCKYIKKK